MHQPQPGVLYLHVASSSPASFSHAAGVLPGGAGGGGGAGGPVEARRRAISVQASESRAEIVMRPAVAVPDQPYGFIGAPDVQLE